MTNFEHMKEKVLHTVAALDEVELKKLISDTCMDEGDTEGIFSCAFCEGIYGECNDFLEGTNCMKKYLDWCGKEYKSKVNRDAIAEAIKRYGIPQEVDPVEVEEDKADIMDKLSELLEVTKTESGIMLELLKAIKMKSDIRT